MAPAHLQNALFRIAGLSRVGAEGAFAYICTRRRSSLGSASCEKDVERLINPLRERRRRGW